MIVKIAQEIIYYIKVNFMIGIYVKISTQISKELICMILVIIVC